MKFPENLEEYRFFVLGSEVLRHLGIRAEEVNQELSSNLAQNVTINPLITSFPKHQYANPTFTMHRHPGLVGNNRMRLLRKRETFRFSLR